MVQLSRRAFVALAAGSTTLSSCSSIAASYDRVVNMVADAGCDPAGREPCDDSLRRVATDGTLLWFPPGTYFISEPIILEGQDRLGFVGNGDVHLRAPDGFAGKLMNIQVGLLEFRNIDFNIEAPNTSAGLRVVCERGFRIENVTFHGRGTHTTRTTASALSPAVTNPSGFGVVKNLVARHGSGWANYKNGGGRGGIHVGGRHRGTIRIIDCHLSEFGNNGVYGSDTPGDVQVIGGVYRNNNVAGIRLGGAGSYIEGARIEVDPAKYGGPRTHENDAFNMRGVVVEQKPEKWGWKDAGVVIRNADIYIAPNPSGSAAAIHAWHSARTVSIEDTSIRMDENSPAIRRTPQRDTATRHSSVGARWIQCDNLTVSGSASGSPAIQLNNADRSRLVDSHIEQTGAGSDGILLQDSRNCLIDGGYIETTRFPIHIRSSEQTLDGDGNCIVTFKDHPNLQTSTPWLTEIRDGDTPTKTLNQGWLFGSSSCVDNQLIGPLANDQDDGINVVVVGTGTRALMVSAVVDGETN